MYIFLLKVYSNYIYIAEIMDSILFLWKGELFQKKNTFCINY